MRLIPMSLLLVAGCAASVRSGSLDGTFPSDQKSTFSGDAPMACLLYQANQNRFDLGSRIVIESSRPNSEQFVEFYAAKMDCKKSPTIDEKVLRAEMDSLIERNSPHGGPLVQRTFMYKGTSVPNCSRYLYEKEECEGACKFTFGFSKSSQRDSLRKGCLEEVRQINRRPWEVWAEDQGVKGYYLTADQPVTKAITNGRIVKIDQSGMEIALITTTPKWGDSAAAAEEKQKREIAALGVADYEEAILRWNACKENQFGQGEGCNSSLAKKYGASCRHAQEVPNPCKSKYVRQQFALEAIGRGIKVSDVQHLEGAWVFSGSLGEFRQAIDGFLMTQGIRIVSRETLPSGSGRSRAEITQEVIQ